VPWAKTPAATVTARVMVAVADWVRNGTSGVRDDRDGLTPIYQRSRLPVTPRRQAIALDIATGLLTSRLCSARTRLRRAVDPGASADPAGLTARARPKARPEAHAANLCSNHYLK